MLSDALAEVLASVFAGVASVAVFYVYQWIRARIVKEEPPKTYSDRMRELTESLVKASSDVDRVLEEMTRATQERESAVSELERQLNELSQQEQDLKARIESLEQVPLPAVEHFADLVETGEKRSATRDYLLFGAGVLVSTVIAVILAIIGL